MASGYAPATAAPQGQGPTYADEKKRAAEASIANDQAPQKIKRVEQKNSDGTVTETVSNAGAKQVIKRDANGKVLSTTTTTNDAVGDPLAGPDDNYGVDAFDPREEHDFQGQGSMVLSPQGPYTTVAQAEYQGAMPEVVEPLSLRERLTPGPRPMNPINQIIMLPGGDDLDELREGEGLPIAPDFGPLILGEEEPLNEPEEAPSLQDRIANYNQPPPQSAAQFQAPPRNWSNFDWTPLRKSVDDVYGTNIAEGSVDPYVAEYKRAVTAFKLNNPSVGKDGKGGSGPLAWAKFHASEKNLKDKIQLNRDLKIEKDLENEEKIKRNQFKEDRDFNVREGLAESLKAYRLKTKAGGEDDTVKSETARVNLNIRKRKLDDMINPKIQNLNTSDKKRYDNVEDALYGIEGMDAALAAGTNPFSLIGDNPYTIARDQYLDAMSRMQSGANLTESEEEFYRRNAPSVLDTNEIRIQKIAKLYKRMQRRRATFGNKVPPRKYIDLKYTGQANDVEDFFGFGDKPKKDSKEEDVKKDSKELKDVKSKRAKNKSEQDKLKKELGL